MGGYGDGPNEDNVAMFQFGSSNTICLLPTVVINNLASQK
jgi:hypothetical protein